MNFNLAVVAGDGIGPEVMEQNINVLNAIGKKFGHTFNYEYVLGGGCAIDKYGEPLPQHTIDVCKVATLYFLVQLVVGSGILSLATSVQKEHYLV